MYAECPSKGKMQLVYQTQRGRNLIQDENRKRGNTGV